MMAECATSNCAIFREVGRRPKACVDVLIAARDRADTIERAVLSALAQDEVRTVIVVDDASTDDTAAKAARCDPSGNRLIVERLPSNVGPAAARNRGLQLSTAPWFAVLDGDDFFLPGRFEALLSKSDDWDFLADDLVQVREDQVGKAALKPVLFGDREEPFALDLESFILGNIRRHGVLRTELGFLKPLIRRVFIEQCGLNYDEKLRLGEDYALYIRALAGGARFLIVPASGYASVIRADSLSALHSKRDLECLRDSDVDLLGSGRLTASQRRALKQHYTSVDCRVQWLRVIDSVKSRQYAGFLAAFFRSPRVSLFLIQRLIEEFCKRALP
ncbi:MAG TPA: glycosyltransferase family 2 protein [Xanthobacteraceae bacterium]